MRQLTFLGETLGCRAAALEFRSDIAHKRRLRSQDWSTAGGAIGFEIWVQTSFILRRLWPQGRNLAGIAIGSGADWNIRIAGQ